MQDPPNTLDCRSRHEELTLRVSMVDDRVLAIVRLLGLEGLHLVPSIQLDHALITTFVERWRPETHTLTGSHSLVGRCACLMCDGPVVRFWL